MSRTNISSTKVTARQVRAKLTEHDTALDTLEASSGSGGGSGFSVRVATTANHALSGLTAIDSVTPIAGNRVLARSQTATEANGIYVAAAGAWTRATDADGADEVVAGMFVFVSEGTTLGDSWYVLTTNDPITVGVTGLTFTKLPTLVELASTAANKGATLIGLRDNGNLYTATTVEAAFAEIGTTVSDLTNAAPVCYSIGINATDFDALGDTDTSQTINLGSPMGAGARVLSVSIKLATAFTGGGNAAVTVDIGSAGDPDALIDGANLFAAAVDGVASSAPLGIAPFKYFEAETQITATFTADVGLKELTAGDGFVEIVWAVI